MEEGQIPIEEYETGNTKHKWNLKKIKSSHKILAEYDYPGNVRELENIIEHAMILSETSEITEKDLPEFMFKNRLRLTAPGEKPSLISSYDSLNIPTLDDMEKQHIQSTLNLLNHNYTETAKKLGISRSTLWRKIKTHNIEKE